MTETKLREDRLRHRLARNGYRLMKARRRDRVDPGYMIASTDIGGVVAGQHNTALYTLTLDDVESWLA